MDYPSCKIKNGELNSLPKTSSRDVLLLYHDLNKCKSENYLMPNLIPLSHNLMMKLIPLGINSCHHAIMPHETLLKIHAILVQTCDIAVQYAPEISLANQ